MKKNLSERLRWVDNSLYARNQFLGGIKFVTFRDVWLWWVLDYPEYNLLSISSFCSTLERARQELEEYVRDCARNVS